MSSNKQKLFIHEVYSVGFCYILYVLCLAEEPDDGVGKKA